MLYSQNLIHIRKSMEVPQIHAKVMPPVLQAAVKATLKAEKNLRTEAVLTRQTKTMMKTTVPQEAEMFLGADQARET